MLRTATYLMRDPFVAEELAQETMLKAFRAIDRFESGTDARAWLLSILRNKRKDYLRSIIGEREQLSLELLAGHPGAAERDHEEGVDHCGALDASSLLEQFEDAEVIDVLKQLPEEIRWTLLLIDVEKLEQEDAAKVLDVPVGTVKSRAHRGRQMLRTKLARRAKELGMLK